MKIIVLPTPLLDLDEVRRGWEVSLHRVYRAVNEGKLTTVSRPGHQRYYLWDEVVREFGEPRREVKPRYRRWSESGTLAA